MDFIKRFLSDDQGKLSSTRLGKLLITLAFIGDWVMHVVRGGDFNPAWSLVALVASVIGLSVAQRFAEKGK